MGLLSDIAIQSLSVTNNLQTYVWLGRPGKSITVYVPPCLSSVRQLSEKSQTLPQGSASRHHGRNFRLEPWGQSPFQTCMFQHDAPTHTHAPHCKHYKALEASRSLWGSADLPNGHRPRMPSSCSICGPGGLWVTTRTSELTVPCTPRDPEGSVPVTCLGPLLLGARLSLQGI